MSDNSKGKLIKKAGSTFDDFKKFAFKGNVIDMAVGVIIGGAFGKIVTSLVNDIVMPPISILTGGIRFSELSVVLRQATEENPALTLNYGSFIQTVIDFFLIALSVYIFVKIASKTQTAFAKKEEEEAVAAVTVETPPDPPKPTGDEILAEIRDILHSMNEK